MHTSGPPGGDELTPDSPPPFFELVLVDLTAGESLLEDVEGCPAPAMSVAMPITATWAATVPVMV